jgi:hypothetical protein
MMRASDVPGPHFIRFLKTVCGWGFHGDENVFSDL